jgi:tellurite resistance protein TehA-like permease
MSDENLSVKVDKWNEILEGVISDTRSLAKDLRESIKFVGFFAGAAVTSALLYINLYLSTQGKPPIVYVLYVIGFTANVALAIWSGQKFLSFRSKYDRLYHIQKELE